MKKMLTASAATVLALAVTVPAIAGGSHCSGGDQSSATTAGAMGMCAGKATAWAGAWLQRSASGTVTVAEVAKRSPAAKAGLKTGDEVLAVNGYDLSNREDRATCASHAECNIGSAVTYTVQRGRSTKTIKLRLERMPANATERFASRQASFDPAFAAVVMPAVD